MSTMKDTLRTIVTIAIFVCTSITAHPQSVNYKVTVLKQQKVSGKILPKGNYSGITHIKGDTFAIVSDKGIKIHIVRIEQSKSTGKILSVKNLSSPVSIDDNQTDCEDIIYNNSTKTLFITDEHNQEIAEYTIDGKLTGRRLDIPREMNKNNIQNNYGFEALAYDSTNGLYWTITESPLKTDISKKPAPLRLQSFNPDLTPSKQYTYYTEEPKLKGKSRLYAFGVSAIATLDDGRLLVMEREIRIRNNYIGSKSIMRLFLTTPLNNGTTTKIEIASFKTYLKLGKTNLANYEGMCKGITLDDGRQTIILINDSQNRAGNALLHLRDYLKVLIIE